MAQGEAYRTNQPVLFFDHCFPSKNHLLPPSHRTQDHKDGHGQKPKIRKLGTAPGPGPGARLEEIGGWLVMCFVEVFGVRLVGFYWEGFGYVRKIRLWAFEDLFMWCIGVFWFGVLLFFLLMSESCWMIYIIVLMLLFYSLVRHIMRVPPFRNLNFKLSFGHNASRVQWCKPGCFQKALKVLVLFVSTSLKPQNAQIFRTKSGTNLSRERLLRPYPTKPEKEKSWTLRCIWEGIC